MNFRNVTAGVNDVQRRIDKIIRIYIPQISLSLIYKYLRKGLIKVNGKKVHEDYKIQLKDEIQIAEFIFNDLSAGNKDIKEKTKDLSLHMPDIVFENEHILILNKPYDVLVHGDDYSLDKVVVAYFNEKKLDTSLAFKPGPLHRIDKKTTGLIAFSMSINGARWFTENIKKHSISKKYYGLIEGKLNSQEIWQDYIQKNQNSSNKFHTVNIYKNQKNDNKIPENAKDAYTKVTPLKYGKLKNKDVTFVEFDIKTGRMHQIRAQCQLHNHSLLGDTAYGGTVVPDAVQEFYLQAYKLSFPLDNPLGLPEQIEIPPADNFYAILKSCGIEI